MCAAEGYPGAVRTGDVIEGIGSLDGLSGVHLYCAGVATDPQSRLVTAGGRVLGITALAGDVEAARSRAYDAVSRLSWPGMLYRNDIGLGV
jgi:phosphoribosylamine--glycine ligase